jgi:signal transduction histidine kinase
MRERIAQLGGEFEIRSGKNGTVVVAILPVTTVLAGTDGLAS